MRNILVYDGVSSENFGLYVGFRYVENAPKRVIESIAVPGRNGELTIDYNRYENIEVSYPCVIRSNFEENIAAARSYYLSKAGYKRLEDSANPDEFRMARYTSGLEVTPSQMRKQGMFTLKFDCMPQRFLKSGEQTVEFTADGTIYNETLYDAKPLIRVYGTGEIGIGSETITISTNPGYIDIDCEMMDAYYGAVNCNSYITLSSGEFPVLEPGNNGVTLGTNINKVEITPRWWKI